MNLAIVTSVQVNCMPIQWNTIRHADELNADVINMHYLLSKQNLRAHRIHTHKNNK